MQVKSFPNEMSVNAELLFRTIIEETSCDILQKVCSVMADTTALNTGRISGVNKRLEDYFNGKVGHDIHTLECLFHVNEIYLSHVISMVEGKKKGPGAVSDGALLNNIPYIEKSDIESLVARCSLNVPVTSIAKLHLKAKLEWFSQQKAAETGDDSFRTDQLCMLVLAGHLVTEIPANLRNLLTY